MIEVRVENTPIFAH